MRLRFDSEQRGQAELAIHRAAHLAGHTNGCSFPGAACRFCLVAGLAAVARFAPISFRHPDGFHALSIATGHQVAHRAVTGNELLLDTRKPDRHSFLGQAPSKILRERRNLLESFHSLAVKRFKKLAGTVSRLPELLHQRGLTREAEVLTTRCAQSDSDAIQ